MVLRGSRGAPIDRFDWLSVWALGASAMKHNRGAEQQAEPVVNPVESNQICLLLTDGRLFGPFKSREDATYWAIAQDLKGYSTYDLRKP